MQWKATHAATPGNRPYILLEKQYENRVPSQFTPWHCVQTVALRRRHSAITSSTSSGSKVEGGPHREAKFASRIFSLSSATSFRTASTRGSRQIRSSAFATSARICKLGGNSDNRS